MLSSQPRRTTWVLTRKTSGVSMASVLSVVLRTCGMIDAGESRCCGMGWFYDLSPVPALMLIWYRQTRNVKIFFSQPPLRIDFFETDVFLFRKKGSLERVGKLLPCPPDVITFVLWYNSIPDSLSLMRNYWYFWVTHHFLQPRRGWILHNPSLSERSSRRLGIFDGG